VYLQQQAALPDFTWVWLLPGLPLAALISTRQPWLRVARAILIALFAAGLGFYHAAWQAEQRLAISLPDEWQGRDNRGDWRRRRTTAQPRIRLAFQL